MKIFALLGLLWLALPVPALAAEAQPRAPVQAPEVAIDHVVQTEMARQHIPGLALAVLMDGRVVLARGYGAANIEGGSAVSAGTVFSIGSLSKSFLAAAMMLLVEDGKVALDDPVTDYLPDAPESWRGITIRRLLNHTAGLVREGPAFRPDRTVPDIEVIRSAYASPLMFAPGERFEYSNLGYFVVAEIISRRAGMAWPEFVKTRIFDVVGMTASGLTGSAPRTGDEATGYEWRDGRNAPVQPMAAVRPSGAFVSSLSDLARWDRALDGDTVLSAASRRQMWTMSRLNDGSEAAYGLGWRLEQTDGRLEVGHGGSLPGFRSYHARYPDAHLSVIVLTNEGDDDPRTIARTVARTVLAR